VAALIAAYKLSPEWTGKQPSTRTNYGYYLRDLEALAAEPVAGVRRRTLIAMRDAIAAVRGPGAANVFMRTAATLFRWAVDREWIDHSPAERVRQLPGGHLAAWTAQEADIAEAKLPAELARVVLLGRYTGQRRSDLIAMTWSAYDGQTLRVRQQKGGATLVIPCHPALRSALERWKAERASSTHILLSASGRPWQANHLTHTMAIELPKIGLRDELNVHGLRKLAATALADAGCTAHEIAAVTGHRTLAMVQLYTASADQQKLASAAIVRLGKRPLENAKKRPASD
jgi:integrase